MEPSQKYIRCVGCGALVPDSDGPTHRYVGASPGCWQLHGELLVKAQMEYHSPVWQMVVDTYCVQHPGVPGPQSRQSVAVHLMDLCMVLERGMDPKHGPKMLQHFTQGEYPWLEPPEPTGQLTIVEVLAARDRAEHIERVKLWARSVWDGWSAHQAMVRQWLDGLGFTG